MKQDRRRFLSLAALGAFAPWLAKADGHSKDSAKQDKLEQALAVSPYVYISPLRSSGDESRCHGEVWYGWIDRSVVIITGAERWKHRAFQKGLETARVWVGDYGRWKGALAKNEAFRSGPHFDARVETVRSRALLDRLLALYEKKYPAEIAKWRGPMRTGYEKGERVLIRYWPL